MAILIVVVLAVAAVLAACAAYPVPARYQLGWFAVALIALALLLERWPGG